MMNGFKDQLIEEKDRFEEAYLRATEAHALVRCATCGDEYLAGDEEEEAVVAAWHAEAPRRHSIFATEEELRAGLAQVFEGLEHDCHHDESP